MSQSATQRIAALEGQIQALTRSVATLVEKQKSSSQAEVAMHTAMTKAISNLSETVGRLDRSLADSIDSINAICRAMGPDAGDKIQEAYNAIQQEEDAKVVKAISDAADRQIADGKLKDVDVVGENSVVLYQETIGGVIQRPGLSAIRTVDMNDTLRGRSIGKKVNENIDTSASPDISSFITVVRILEQVNG